MKVEKALLLAAGIGSRLRPLTEITPKCLLPVSGKPILGWWLDRLGSYGVKEVVVNTHHLPGQIAAYVASRRQGPAVHLSKEEKLLGSAGTIGANWDRLSSNGAFFVCNADTLTDVDLTALAAAHDAGQTPLTLTVFRSNNPSACGIVECDSRGVVTSFEEKPVDPRSDLANGGVYLMGSGIRPDLPARPPADIGYHLLPRFVGRMTAFEWDGVLHDIGTIESYEEAGRIWGARREVAA